MTNFLRWYDYTAAAILEALPTATVSRTIIAGAWVTLFQERQQSSRGQVGPGNFGAMGTGAEVPHFSYENDTIATAFVRHWASGTNVR